MTDIGWDGWGRLRQCCEPATPRRLLALDGGGIRGLMTLQVLARLETLLAGHPYPADAAKRQAFRLCHFFDYIAGTSTGAIIAAGLARGMAVAEVESVYREVGKEAFAKRSRHDHGALIPLSQDLGRAFLYCRYDAELSPAGLRALGLPDIDPEAVIGMDKVDAMPQLTRVGQAVARQVELGHFGGFTDQPLAVAP